MCKSANHEHNMTPAGKPLYCHCPALKTDISKNPHSNNPLVKYKMIMNKYVKCYHKCTFNEPCSWVVVSMCVCVRACIPCDNLWGAVGIATHTL